MKDITIIIPNKYGQSPKVSVESLYEQTYQNFDLHIINDLDGNACKVRNEGFKLVKTELVLFSDNDINWLPNSLEVLREVLLEHPECSWSYGAWEMGKSIFSQQEYDENLMKKRNYISGCSLFRTKDFPGWDEKIKRLQDWDVFLTLIEQGRKGIYCERLIFRTLVREGITNNSIPYDQARLIVFDKHNKTLPEVKTNLRRRTLR